MAFVTVSTIYFFYGVTMRQHFEWGNRIKPLPDDVNWAPMCTKGNDELDSVSCPMDKTGLHDTPCLGEIAIDSSIVSHFNESTVESYLQSITNGTAKPLMFMHIPKTGGTSIEISGFQHSILWGWKLFNSGMFASMFGVEMHSMCDVEFHRKRCCGAPWHVPLRYWVEYFDAMPLAQHAIERFFDLDQVDYFCVVRNPFNRMISEYKYLLHRSMKMRFKPQRLFKEHSVDIDNMCTERSLNHWVQIALGDYKELQCEEPDMMETHFYPQYESVYDSQCRQICANVVRFEHFEEDLKAVLQRYNLHAVFETLTATHDTKEGMCQEYGLGIQNLTEVSKALIFHRYRHDFQAFNYSAG